MRIKLVRAALVFLPVLFMAVAVFAQADRLRVLSLNAEWFPGRTPASPSLPQQARHIAGIQRLLHDLNPDIWLVQEVNRAEALDRTLAVLPDFSVYTVSAFTDGPHQLAVAGRLPAVSAGTSVWQPGDDGIMPPRGAAFSVVEFSDGSVLPVFTLHLKSNFRGGEEYNEAQNTAMREMSARQFLGFVESARQKVADRIVRGVLLGGDLNFLYPSPLFRGEKTGRILEDGGFVFLGGDGLDHFWGIGITNAVFKVHPEYRVSDHRAITLDIPLPDGVTVARLRRTPPEEVAWLAGEVRTDVNVADLPELMALPGIGPILSQRIVAQRPFASIAELVEVCGIGPITLEQMQPWIVVVPPAKDAP